MLRISFQTLRANRGTLAGAFVAIWLAVTLAYAAGLLLAGALGAPGPAGSPRRMPSSRPIRRSRIADGESVDVAPAPLLDAALVERFAGGVGDVSFAVGAFDAAGARSATAAERPRLGERGADAVHARPPAARPRAPHDVVADARLARRLARAGRHARG